MRPFALVTLALLFAAAALAQQPQTSDVSNTQPLYSVNAKYVEGLGPGYWPTAGSGLTLNITAGTNWCAGTVRTYAGGTLTMTNSTTNYVYLDPTANCAPAASTSLFTAAQIPVAAVVTSGGAITAITDDRTWFLNLTLSSLGGTLGCSQLPSFTGDVLNTLCAMALQNIPNGTTMAGDIVAANLAAPSSPAAAHDSLYTDSTDLRFHDKNASGVIGTTVVAKTAATHKFFNVLSLAGVLTDTQPACGDLSDAGAGCSGGAAGVKVNTSAIAGTNANLSDSTPAAASNHVNVTWQKDATTPDTNISAQVAAATDTVLGTLKSITCSNQFIRSFTTGTGAPACATVDTNDLAANAVTSAKEAVVNTRRVCMMVIGADNAAAVLANADLGPQLDQCFIPFAATVVEIEVMGDAGTPNVIVQRSHLGSATALLSGALATASAGAVACSNTGGTTGLDGTTTCTNTLQNMSVAVGDWIGLTSGTAGGVAKRMSISVTMTVN